MKKRFHLPHFLVGFKCLGLLRLPAAAEYSGGCVEESVTEIGVGFEMFAFRPFVPSVDENQFALAGRYIFIRPIFGNPQRFFILLRRFSLANRSEFFFGIARVVIPPCRYDGIENAEVLLENVPFGDRILAPLGVSFVPRPLPVVARYRVEAVILGNPRRRRLSLVGNGCARIA